MEDFCLDEEDSIDWLQTGVFVVDLTPAESSITHTPTRTRLQNPPCFNGSGGSWTIDANYSTKCARLKNLDNGAVYPLAGMFRDQGYSLPGRTRPTTISPRPKQEQHTGVQEPTVTATEAKCKQLAQPPVDKKKIQLVQATTCS